MSYAVTAPLIDAPGIFYTVNARPNIIQCSVARIIVEVARFYRTRPSEILSERRHADAARPRQIAMYLARELTPKSLPTIARIFKRDHTTVIHAIRRIEELAEKDSDFAVDIEVLRERLGG